MGGAVINLFKKASLGYQFLIVVGVALSLWGSVELFFYFHDKEVITEHEAVVTEQRVIEVKKDEKTITNTFNNPVPAIDTAVDGLLSKAAGEAGLQRAKEDTRDAYNHSQGDIDMGSQNGMHNPYIIGGSDTEVLPKGCTEESLVEMPDLYIGCTYECEGGYWQEVCK